MSERSNLVRALLADQSYQNLPAEERAVADEIVSRLHPAVERLEKSPNPSIVDPAVYGPHKSYVLRVPLLRLSARIWGFETAEQRDRFAVDFGVKAIPREDFAR